jgi:hypothetical protein
MDPPLTGSWLKPAVLIWAPLQVHHSSQQYEFYYHCRFVDATGNVEFSDTAGS